MVDRAIKKIIMVDGDPDFRSSAVAFLQEQGYSCRDFSNAGEAIENLKNYPCDLVITDLVLPDIDGIEFMKTSTKLYPDIDFIIMVGKASLYIYADIIGAGASDYIKKPFDMAEMAARVERVDREKKVVSELRAANKRLEAAIGKPDSMTEKTESASLAKREFLAGMTHEIRTPLNSIVGFADMLTDTNLNDEQRKYAIIIKAGSESLLALIDDILDFSKIEAGKMSLENINFDPEVLCHDICELIRPRIHNKPIKLLCRIGDNVPSKICGDPLRMRQVLFNFLGNAVKFTESGEIELSLNIEETEDGKEKLTLIVRDTGIGISPDRMVHIFEPFQQEKDSIARKYGGTGLGLSICKKIAALMKGDISLQSEPDKGSSFCFTAFMEKADSFDTEKTSPAILTKKKALIANFGNIDTNSIKGVFEADGMETVQSDEVSDALDILLQALNEDQPVDICIVDIGDTGDKGFRLVSQVREKDELFSSTKFFALSFPSSGCAKRCEEAGFDAFLTIPVKNNKLLQMTKQLVGIQSRKKDAVNITGRRIMTQYSVREDMKKSIRILVAEDNPVNQRLADLMLKKAGYSVKIVNNGREALNLFISEPEKYDLILMDVQMPEMDGMEATAAIREWEKSQSGTDEQANKSDGIKGKKHIPVVAVTANAQKEDQMKCLESGMDDYLTKPIKREVVFDIIEKWVL